MLKVVQWEISSEQLGCYLSKSTSGVSIYQLDGCNVLKCEASILPSLSEFWGEILRGFHFVLLELKTYTWQFLSLLGQKKKQPRAQHTKKRLPVYQQIRKQFWVLLLCCFHRVTMTAEQTTELTNSIEFNNLSVKGLLKEKLWQEGKYLQEKERESLKASVAAPRGTLAPCTHKLSLTDPPKGRL